MLEAAFIIAELVEAGDLQFRRLLTLQESVVSNSKEL